LGKLAVYGSVGKPLDGPLPDADSEIEISAPKCQVIPKKGLSGVKKGIMKLLISDIKKIPKLKFPNLLVRNSTVKLSSLRISAVSAAGS
jgi:hypothetical protein